MIEFVYINYGFPENEMLWEIFWLMILAVLTKYWCEVKNLIYFLNDWFPLERKM